MFRLRSLLKILFVGFFIFCGITVKAKEVRADSIKNDSQTIISSEKEVADSKYSFIAKINEKTKVIPFGNVNWQKMEMTGDMGDLYGKEYFAISELGNVSAKEKGHFGVLYQNVGNYGGQIIDLKLTIMDWDLTQTNAEKELVKIGVDTISLNPTKLPIWVRMDYLVNGKAISIPVSGYMSIVDMDYWQSVEFSKDTTSHIDQIYISDAAADFLGSIRSSDKLAVYAQSLGLVDPDDPKGIFTFLYSDTDHLEFAWNQSSRFDGDIEKSEENIITNLKRSYNTNHSVNDAYALQKDSSNFESVENVNGAYFGYIAKKPVKTATIPPVKQVTDSNEKLVDSNTLIDRDEQYSYQVTHKTPDEYESFFYSSYVFEDNLNSVLERVGKVVIVDESGIDRTSWFEIDPAVNGVRYSAKASTLKNPEFYGRDFYTKFDVKIKADADLDSLKDKTGVTSIGNTVKVTVDGISKEDSTITKVKEPKEEKPTKDVVDTVGKTINGKEVLPGQMLEYKIAQKVNQLGIDISNRYTKFEIKDVLPAQVTYQLSKLVDDKGQELDQKGTYTYDKSSHTLTYTASNDYLGSMKLAGETVFLSVIVKVNTDAKDQESIVNKASVSINNSKKDTNDVENKVKVPEIKDPTKSVKDKDGADYNGQTVYAGDQLIFDVSQEVNVLGEDIAQKYSEFRLVDKLDEKVAFVKAEVLKGSEVLEKTETISYDEKTHTVTFIATADFLKSMEMKGETYVLKIYTKVINEIAEGQTIVNKATSFVNQSEKETNETTNPIAVPKGNIELTKLTNQLVGIRTNVDTETKESNPLAFLMNSFVIRANADSFGENTIDNGLVYEKRPQAGVTYELTAIEDITFPNKDLISEKGTVFGTYTTDKSGKIKIDDLYSGSYQLQEVSAPVGIQVDPKPIDVELVAGEGEKEISVSTEHIDPLQEVKIDFTKHFENEDGSFTPGEGATFGLYYGQDKELEDGNKIKIGDLIATLEPDKNGLYTYQDVMIPGMVYYVSEISTREGYQKLLDQFRFVYEPVSNAAVHEITLFGNGYEENGKMNAYMEASGAINEVEDTTKTTDSTTEMQPSTEESTNTSTEISATEVTETSTEVSASTTETTESSTETSTEKPVVGQEITKQEPIKNLLIKASTIDKKILTKDQQLVTDYQLLSEQETVTFVGTVTIGDEEKGLPITISDKLPEGFSYKKYTVVDANGKDVTSQTTVEVKDQLVTVILAQEYADTLTRTQLTLTLETIYNYDPSHKGQTFDNIFDLTIGDKVISSEKVRLTAPAEKEVVPLPQTGTDLKRFIGLGLLILSAGVAGVAIYRYRVIKK